MLGQKEIQDSKRAIASGPVADRTVAGGGQPHRLVAGGVPDHRGVAASSGCIPTRCSPTPVKRCGGMPAIRRPLLSDCGAGQGQPGSPDRRTGDRAVHDLMDQAGSRQDFHMLNRVQTLPGWPPSTVPRRWPQAVGTDAPPDLLDADEMEEIARHGHRRHGGHAGQGGPQAGEANSAATERSTCWPMLSPTRRLARFSRTSSSPSVRDDGRARDRRPRPTGAAMTGLAAVETSGQ